MKERYELYKVAIVISLILLAFLVVFKERSMSTSNEISSSSQEMQLRFDLLSNAHTNLCAAPSAIYTLNTDYLQGSCCGPMDFDRYEEQIKEIRKYSYLEDIVPMDPYNVSFSMAEKLLNYDQTITLNPSQQKIYDAAVSMSEDNGPCCCACWRWYAFEGQAKYLITEKGFNASQIAELWGMEDGCGGSD